MAKTRSPGYPAIGLREAVERVELVYKQDYQNSLPREVVAGHMGYQGLNGKSFGVLSALGKFGLLEGRGNDTRVSDLAVQIIAHPPGTPERAQALVEAAEKPELFAELDAKFQGGKASDQAIRSYLLTQKFIPTAAEIAIRAYRDTKTMVQAEGGHLLRLAEEPAERAPASELAVPPAEAVQKAPGPLWVTSTSDEPYTITLTPGGGIEVVARLQFVEDAEALRDDIDGFIVLLSKRKERESQRAEMLTKVAFAQSRGGLTDEG